MADGVAYLNELDRLIQSTAFENSRQTHTISAERQKALAYQSQLNQCLEEIRQLEHATSKIDAEVRANHKQLMQCTSNLDSLKKTSTFLDEHLETLHGRLKDKRCTSEEYHKEQTEAIQKYRAKWDDYKVKYEARPWSKAFQQLQHELKGIEDKNNAMVNQKSVLENALMVNKDQEDWLIKIASLRVETNTIACSLNQKWNALLPSLKKEIELMHSEMLKREREKEELRKQRETDNRKASVVLKLPPSNRKVVPLPSVSLPQFKLPPPLQLPHQLHGPSHGQLSPLRHGQQSLPMPSTPIIPKKKSVPILPPATPKLSSIRPTPIPPRPCPVPPRPIPVPPKFPLATALKPLSIHAPKSPSGVHVPTSSSGVHVPTSSSGVHVPTSSGVHVSRPPGVVKPLSVPSTPKVATPVSLIKPVEKPALAVPKVQWANYDVGKKDADETAHSPIKDDTSQCEQSKQTSLDDQPYVQDEALSNVQQQSSDETTSNVDDSDDFSTDNNIDVSCMTSADIVNVSNKAFPVPTSHWFDNDTSPTESNDIAFDLFPASVTMDSSSEINNNFFNLFNNGDTTADDVNADKSVFSLFSPATPTNTDIGFQFNISPATATDNDTFTLF